MSDIDMIYEEAADFAALMGERLAAHDNRHGTAWKGMGVDALMQLVYQNMEELEIALKYDNDVADKAADVANLLWMVADRAEHGED